MCFKIKKLKKKDNIKYYYVDIFKDNIDENIKQEILTSDLIFMDAGDHLNMTYELFLISFLKKENYKGIIIFDDIKLNDDMKKVWGTLEGENIFDISHIGHWSGTGIWITDNNIQLIF